MSIALGTSVEVPHAVFSPAERDVLDSVTGDLQRVRPALAYRLAMIPLLALVLMLPLVYVALIGVVGWAVTHHAMHHLHWVIDARVKVFGLVMYTGPLLAGALVVIFMIKPIFAPRPQAEASLYTLERAQEPFMYAFVERLAVTLGAPAPARIEVSCLPNASASMGYGLAAVFSRDLTLTLGTPLIASMNTRQLAGVIAHELGHFSQGAGMRSTYLINRINGWFARMVYERDAWDERMSHHAQHGTFLWTMVIVWCCVVSVWMTRWVLWVLMMVSHAMSCVMVRRMELDADAKSVRLAGSETVAGLFQRLAELDWVFMTRASQMQEARERGRLAENLPTYVAGTIEALPEDVREQVRQGVLADHDRSWFSSHPALGVRIERAQAANEEGLITAEQPASVLLRNFEVICRWTTLGFYRDHLHENISAEGLLPTETLLERTRLGVAAMAAGPRYYQDAMSLLHPIPLDGIRAGTSNSVAKLTDALVRARTFILARAAEARRAAAEAGRADDSWCLAVHAKARRKAGLSVAAHEFGLADASDEAIEAALARSRALRESARTSLAPMNKAVAVRLTATLRLLEREEVSARLTNREELAAQACLIIDMLRALDEVEHIFEELRAAHVELIALLVSEKEGGDSDTYLSRVRSRCNLVHELLQRLVSMLRDTPYPFEHSRESYSVANAVAAELPPRNDPGAVAHAGEAAIGETFELRREAMDRLALIGEQVERACDLAPLPQPPKPEDG